MAGTATPQPLSARLMAAIKAVYPKLKAEQVDGLRQQFNMANASIGCVLNQSYVKQQAWCTAAEGLLSFPISFPPQAPDAVVASAPEPPSAGKPADAPVDVATPVKK